MTTPKTMTQNTMSLANHSRVNFSSSGVCELASVCVRFVYFVLRVDDMKHSTKSFLWRCPHSLSLPVFLCIFIAGIMRLSMIPMMLEIIMQLLSVSVTLAPAAYQTMEATTL